MQTNKQKGEVPFCGDIWLPVLLTIVGSAELLPHFHHNPISLWQDQARSEQAAKKSTSNYSGVLFVIKPWSSR
jgi:hypothetical protein